LLDASTHGRIHRVRAARELTALESGFAVGLDRPGDLGDGALRRDADRAVIATSQGLSAIIDVPIAGVLGRRPIGRNLAVNASLMHSRTAVPALQTGVLGTDTTIAAIVVADPSGEVDVVSAVDPVVPPPVRAVLERIAEEELR